MMRPEATKPDQDQTAQLEASSPHAPGHKNLPHGGTRWQWYHYYFVLAIVDVLVMAASFLLNYRTTNSYEIALHKLFKTHARQRSIANLRLSAMELNAPGNDVFETRDIAGEKARFERQRAVIAAKMKQTREFALDLKEFQSHLNKMIHAEERIFELLEIHSSAETTDKSVDFLEAASRSMASMDRHQSAAITALTEIEQGFLMSVESLLREHGSRIQGNAKIERLFIVLICLILIGMLWYGRKLQRLNEEMVLQNKRAHDERMARLAAVGEVCTAVAHGIRNPLASISSSAQLGLVGDGCSEAARSRMQDILSECRRLDDRVTHLLSFASSTSTMKRSFNLKDVAEQAVTELAPRFHDSGVNVILTFATSPLIQGDRERMVQCMIELMSNALEYAPSNSQVSVSCDSSPDRTGFVDMLVSDQGPGIPPNLAEKVFDLFFTTRPGGTGVGLASVKYTVHSLGGEVTVVPNARMGGMIRVTLPVRN